jgi:hypothetical protein
MPRRGERIAASMPAPARADSPERSRLPQTDRPAGAGELIRAVAFAGVTDRPDLEAAVTAGYRWDAGGPGQARPGGVVLLSPDAHGFG